MRTAQHIDRDAGTQAVLRAAPAVAAQDAAKGNAAANFGKGVGLCLVVRPVRAREQAEVLPDLLLETQANADLGMLPAHVAHIWRAAVGIAEGDGVAEVAHLGLVAP